MNIEKQKIRVSTAVKQTTKSDDKHGRKVQINSNLFDQNVNGDGLQPVYANSLLKQTNPPWPTMCLHRQERCITDTKFKLFLQPYRPYISTKSCNSVRQKNWTKNGFLYVLCFQTFSNEIKMKSKKRMQKSIVWNTNLRIWNEKMRYVCQSLTEQKFYSGKMALWSTK